MACAAHDHLAEWAAGNSLQFPATPVGHSQCLCPMTVGVTGH